MVERWQQQSRQRLALLVLLSLALHLPLLMTFNNSIVLPVTNTATSLSVEIISKTEDKQPVATQSKKPETQQQNQPSGTETTRVVKQEQPSHKRKTEKTERILQNQNNKLTHEKQIREFQTHKALPTKQPAGQPTTNKAQVQHKLQLELRNHFYYPRLARRHGYQGTVTLSFELHRRGAIEKIQILQSSGHRILDLAARDAVRQMTIGWASELLHESSMQIELPVQYILTEG
ncbi:MAG: TonB family protein [Thiohalophilus sp.]|uniref:energy transducer TonB n=1 Tax=Thiohalophilus sp. TaxID=3028392 RepID=UPI00286FEDC2|nr:TonB family protein [Thiohalophilus sp.]MDR9436685.1 TonB family protein [Thiohalophilus sp.]